MKKLILLLLIIPIVSLGQRKVDINYVVNQDNSVNFNYKKNVVGSYLVVSEFSNLSKMKPGSRDGKLVKVTYSVPITFRMY